MPYNYMVSFEWDKKKNAINYKKDKVRFEDAQLAFLDKKKIFL